MARSSKGVPTPILAVAENGFEFGPNLSSLGALLLLVLWDRSFSCQASTTRIHVFAGFSNSASLNNHPAILCPCSTAPESVIDICGFRLRTETPIGTDHTIPRLFLAWFVGKYLR